MLGLSPFHINASTVYFTVVGVWLCIKCRVSSVESAVQPSIMDSNFVRPDIKEVGE